MLRLRVPCKDTSSRRTPSTVHRALAYRGGTVSAPFCSLVHVPLDATERTGTKRKGVGGWDVRAWLQARGGVVTSPDVKGVIVM